MAKMNFSRVNKENLIYNRGFDYVDNEVQRKSRYDEIPTLMPSSRKSRNPKANIIRRRKVKPGEGVILSNKERSRVISLDKELHSIITRVNLLDNRKIQTGKALYDQLIATVKAIIDIDPCWKDKPVNPELMKTYKKLERILSGRR